MVSRTSQTLKLLKEKVVEIQKILDDWASVPILDQREAKALTLTKFQTKYKVWSCCLASQLRSSDLIGGLCE